MQFVLAVVKGKGGAAGWSASSRQGGKVPHQCHVGRRTGRIHYLGRIKEIFADALRVRTQHEVYARVVALDPPANVFARHIHMARLREKALVAVPPGLAPHRDTPIRVSRCCISL